MRSGRLLFFIFSILFSVSLFSQTVVTIGTASSTSSTSGPANSTTSGARNDRHMCIYSVAELTAAGVTAGTPLMSIAWEKTGAAFYNEDNLVFRVWIKHSASTTFPANPTFATESGSATLVFETTTGSIPAAAGWITFPFNQAPSFTWNGTENLQVITEQIRSTDLNATGFSWRTITSVTNAAANANAVASAPPATLTRTGTRPQIRLGIPSPGLDAAIQGISSPVSGPAGVQNIDVQLMNTGNVTLTTADINWSVDAGPPTLFPWTGSLAPGAQVTVTVGSNSFANGSHSITATVSNPNGSPDVNPSNDSFTKIISTCSPLSGAYTINSGAPTSGTNFQTFTAFSNALSGCGVSGPVTATVALGSGPYVEQVVFQNIPGSGVSAPIIIEGNGETITSAGPIIQTGDNPERHIVRLVDLSYFTVNNLHVEMVSGSTGFIGIHILFSGDHITISNCSVDMGTGTSTLLGAIAATGSRSSLLAQGTFSNLTYTGNSSSAGGYGAVIYGASNTTTINNVISNNTFTGSNSNGIYVFGTGGTQIIGNTVNFAASNGIQLAQQDNINALVQGNWISCNNPTSTLTFRGIYVFGSTPGTPNKVINNVIRDMNAPAGQVIGIANRTTGAEFYFNTVILDDATATSVRAFGFEEDLSNLGSTLRNNIFYISQSTTNYAAAIALTNTSNVTTINTNYNTFFTANGAHVAVRKGTLTTNAPINTYTLLTDWQTANGGEANSFQTDPQFQAGTAIPQSGVINGQGTAITGITTDILGVTRSNPPDPGAYEFSPPAGDAALTAYVLPALPHCANTLDVQFTLTNAGSDPLNTVTIDWMVNGVPQPTVNWAGPTLASGASTTVTLGNIPVASNTLYNFSATVSNPNGFPDVNPANDNFSYTGFRKGFDSPITINAGVPASPTNFQTFQSLADQLALYGVCAPVVITVSGGPYTEMVTFNTIPGSNSVNTVTLNGNTQILQSTVTNMEEAVLRLSGVEHMIVENLTVNCLHPTDGRGIHITNDASKIAIRNNTVNVSTTNSVSSSFGIIISGANWLLDGSLSDSVVITGNTVTGGYSAIQLSGVHWTQPLTRIRVANNTVLDWYGFGIYLSYTNGALVESNTIRRPTRTNSGSDAVTPAGITIPAGSLNFKLDKNRMYDFHMAMPGSSTISRGVHMSGTSIAPTSGTIQNNLIYGMRNAGAQYGIQNNSVNGPVNIWHNTIVLDGPDGASTSNTSAIRMSNFSTQLGTDIRNNVFVVTRGGTGEKNIMDISAASSVYTSNYNVAWLNTVGGTQAYGQVGTTTTYTTFANWQAGTGKDANSVFIDPLFTNPAAGNFTPTNFLGDGSVMNTVSVGVPDDILGTPRSANPDPGAFEFIPPPCSSANGGTASAAATTFCATGSTTLSATGYSTGIGLTYQWQSSNDNFVSNVNNLAGQTNPATLATGTITSTTYYRLRVTCSTGPIVAYSNIVTITINQPAVITAQPVNRTVCFGASATFSVTATGALSYQWQLFNGTTWNNVAGATSSSITVSNATVAMNTNSYRVIVTGQCGPVTSNHATLYVNALPTIILNTSQVPELLPGQSLNITAQVSPAGGTYVWYKNNAVIAGATASSLNGLTVDDAGSYHLVYTDLNGCTNTSSALTVTSKASGNFYVYPVPNVGNFQVRFYNTAGEVAVLSMYDSKGALVYRRTYTTSLPYTQLEVSLPNITAGSYLVTVQGAGGRKIGAKWIAIFR